MNILDYIVLGIIGFCIVRGVIKGLILSVFHVASFFIAAIGAAKLYPVLSNRMMQTSVYKEMEKNIAELMLKRAQLILQQTSASVETTAGNAALLSDGDTAQHGIQALLDSFILPESITSALINGIDLDINHFIDFESIIEQLSGNISAVIVNILSIVIIFLAIRAILFGVSMLLDMFMKLPILNELNKIAGGIFGAVNGLLIVYVLFAVFALLAPTQVFIPLLELVEQSRIASLFYNHNILLNLILKVN